ncbi:coiled-coil domain-containing protein 42 homolog [Xiphias gladius]|uniref:coiled-coil domain-containing protein 42 homolog n=1 Tax=Xiphias gladius TaxID=8245 RepID=UPI001A9980FD|nr:coiled-coil domain-containing protein 42 homolog [Xiphias gladius]
MSLSKPIRREQVSRGPCAGASLGTKGAPDTSSAVFELLKKRREDEELKAVLQERKQKLKGLQQRVDELRQNLQKVQDLQLSFDMFLKDEAADRVIEKTERERKELLQQDAEIQKLKEEKVELMERKQKLECEVQRHTVYEDIMEQIVKRTKFEDVDSLVDHLQSQLHLRDQLYQRQIEAEEQADRQRKALAALEDQYDLLQLQKNRQLSRLQTELEEMRSEALTWERKWNHIQETAAKKTLLLGQIKMATLNLYEMAAGSLGEEESVDINDTEKQLDKIKMFIQDHEDIVEQHQTPSQRHNDGQNRNRGKKCIATHSKKH